MKTNTIKDLKTKTEIELVSLLDELKRKLQGFSFDLKLGKLQNVGQISRTKKEVARIKMIMRLNHGKRI